MNTVRENVATSFFFKTKETCHRKDGTNVNVLQEKSPFSAFIIAYKHVIVVLFGYKNIHLVFMSINRTDTILHDQ